MVELLVFLSNWAYFIFKCCLFCSCCKSFKIYMGPCFCKL